MVITYHNIEFFKVQFGDTVLAFNPISKDSKYSGSNFGADIALITTNHPDMNGVETVTRGDKEPFVIQGPGEYEVDEISIQGIQTETEYGGTKKINTVYLVNLEGMRLCFLGALSSLNLPQSLIEKLDEVDVLFVPIGDEGVLNGMEAHKLGVQLEARIIIPMHYGDIGASDALKTFLKEEGESKDTPLDKLTLKPKDLDDKEGNIILLNVS
jgi:L-ascorbate metabolism protein UlaG (beta-lactamase superfamily)